MRRSEAASSSVPSVQPDDPAALHPRSRRRAWIEVDAGALDHNLRVLAHLAGPGARVAAVVKADAYGHGLVAAARTFVAAGAAMLCVATVDEVLALRSAGVTAPVLLLYPPPVAALPDLVAQGVTIPVASEEGARELAAAWKVGRGLADGGRGRLAADLPLHLEVETGLTRTGVPPDRCASVAAVLGGSPGLGIEGLWSHLARPDDAAACAAQLAQLDRATGSLAALGIRDLRRHLAATGGLLAGTAPPLDLVRPGLALYGVVPDDLPIPTERRAAVASLRPALSLHARPLRILEVPVGTPVSYGGRWVAERRSRIMTLPVGYGDGYARGTGPGAQVLVNGRRAPIVGSIAMDALMVDITDVPDVGPDADVVLLGAQGADRIGAEELARQRTTIAWEVLTGLALRIPRVYHRAAGTAPEVPSGSVPGPG